MKFKTLSIFGLVVLAIGLSTMPGVAQSQWYGLGPVSIKHQAQWGELGKILHEDFECHNPPLNPSRAALFIGLTKEESVSFQRTFASLSKGLQIHAPQNHFFWQHEGPPAYPANYINDHIGFFVRSLPTTEIQTQIKKWQSSTESSSGHQEKSTAVFGFDTSMSLWTTNSSLILDGGNKTEAPYTGCIQMVGYDNQYSAKSFREFVSSLEREVMKQWTNRSVEVFVSEGSVK
jgi:hypothetical protein